MSETELKETLSEEALERLNDRYGFWRKGKCDRDVMCALNELVSHRQRLAAAEQRATDTEATLATIGGADKATLARKLRRANAATRDAEQRATESEALVRECAEAMIAGSNTIILLVDALGITGAEDDPLVQAALHEQEVVQGRLLTLGLRARDSAPATQPDERVAAERAVIAAARPVLGMLRGTHSAFNQVIYVQALSDALGALDALDATDGAAKEY